MESFPRPEPPRVTCIKWSRVTQTIGMTGLFTLDHLVQSKGKLTGSTFTLDHPVQSKSPCAATVRFTLDHLAPPWRGSINADAGPPRRPGLLAPPPLFPIFFLTSAPAALHRPARP